MLLSVADRIVLLDILPAQGTFLTMKIVRQLRDNLHFSEEELAEFGLRQTATGYEWDTSRDVEVPVGPKAHETIAEALKRLDAEGKISDREFSLYERFVPEEGE